jgi:hypothetical protein
MQPVRRSDHHQINVVFSMQECCQGWILSDRIVANNHIHFFRYHITDSCQMSHPAYLSCVNLADAAATNTREA